MEFRLLGPLEVWDAGQALQLRGSKRRAVLALLALHANEVVRSERLIGELWGERPPANASAALQSHISRLRKDLGAEVVVTKPWGYVLRAEPEAIDLCHFEMLVARAKPLPAAERRVRLTEALELWRGPALADLANEPALAMEATRLDELRLGALEQRFDAELELGEHEQLVPELEALIGEHPLRERLRGQLILALYRSGHQAEALETYRETRRVLVEELGIEPTPELRELERAILRQDPALAAVAAIQPAEQPPPTNRWRWPRSPLALAVALLAMAAAGTGLAALLTRGSTSPDVTPAVAALAALPTFSPTTVTDGRAQTPPPPPHPAEHASAGGSPTTAASLVHHVVHTKPRPHHASHTDTHAALPPPPPPPPPAPSKYIYWIADDFSDPAFNFLAWHKASHGTGVEVAEQAGKLHFTISGDATMEDIYGADQHYGTMCRLTGDFDARIDYELLEWPARNGLFVSLGVWTPPPSEGFWTSSRQGASTRGGSEAYGTNVGNGRWGDTIDTNGRLRIGRSNGRVTMYYRYRNTWVTLGSRSIPGPAVILVGLWTNASDFGRQPAEVAFDNFQTTADDVDCQGVPLPPRRKRKP